MRKAFHDEWRSEWMAYLLCAVIVGIFFSRALASISLMAFCAVSVIHGRWKQQLKASFQTPLMLLMMTLWFLPLLSGIWSEDKNEWLDIVRIKLPFFVLPIAFAGWKPFRWTYIKWPVFVLAILCIGGLVWSLAEYLLNRQIINEGYLRSKTIPTPMEDDHIRFSFLLAVLVFVLVYMLEILQAKWLKISAVALTIVIIIYLHLLSARTGLATIYLGLGLYVIHRILKKSRRFIMLLPALILLPIVAYFLLPTFQNRVKYFRYDIAHVLNDQYLPGANDGGRSISIQAGWRMISNAPMGVGAGDIRKETEAWYDNHRPPIAAGDRLYPSSEWLVYGGTAGWPGMILFTAFMLLPFFLKIQKGIFLAMTQAGAFVCFLADSFIEGQNGVIIYSMIILCWYTWLKHAASGDRCSDSPAQPDPS